MTNLLPTRNGILFTLIVGLHGMLSQAAVGADSPEVVRRVLNERYVAEVITIREVTTERWRREILIDITNKTNGTHDTLVFPTRIKSVSDMTIVQDSKLVLSGKLPRGGYCFLIMKMDNGALQDRIWTYRHSLSPSKRFLIYASYHPPHCLPAYRRSILLIYDLLKGSPSNRRDEYTKRQFDYMVGTPVFPERNAFEYSYDVTIDDEYVYQSPLLWSKDETRVVFFVSSSVEHGDYLEHNYIVNVDLSAGIRFAQVIKKVVDIRSLAKWDIMDELTKKRLESRPFYLNIRDLRWVATDRVVAGLFFHEYWLNDKIELPVPK